MSETRMNPELKAKWLEALRSGEYEQCVGVLHDGHGYCCLGVLYRVITGDVPKRHWERGVLSGEDVDVCEMPQQVDRTIPATELVEMNDGGASFGEIADWIEANL